MKRYTLLIVGHDIETAEMRARAVGCAEVRERTSRTTTLRVHTDLDIVPELNRWLCEPPMQPPYPNGALLHWRCEP